MNSRVPKIMGISGFLLCLATALSFAQKTPPIPGLPGTLTWQNAPRAWNIDRKNVLTISSNPKTDWFVDPFDGTVAKTAPILLFTPGPDYVLSARVAVQFTTKWDAGALMLWGDDHHWAKLSYEFSPDQKPTLVTVVTRGLSDDCNSLSLAGDSVYLRMARVATPTSFTSQPTEKIGKSSARLAWIRTFPYARASNRSRPKDLGRLRSSPPSPTIRIALAIFTNSSAMAKTRKTSLSSTLPS